MKLVEVVKKRRRDEMDRRRSWLAGSLRLFLQYVLAILWRFDSGTMALAMLAWPVRSLWR
jgi:hypothetical protein